MDEFRFEQDLVQALGSGGSMWPHADPPEPGHGRMLSVFGR